MPEIKKINGQVLERENGSKLVESWGMGAGSCWGFREMSPLPGCEAAWVSPNLLQVTPVV